MRKINIGLIGFGNVGSGVVKILRDKKSLLNDKINSEINIKKICDKDIISKRNVSVDRKILTNNVQDIINDPQIDVVVELIGGIHPAKEYIISALKKAKILLRQIKPYWHRRQESYLLLPMTVARVFILRLRWAQVSLL